jgi:hypothetical protein
MSSILIVVVLGLVPVVATGQAPGASSDSDPPDVIVLKKRWHKSRLRPGWDRFNDPSIPGDPNRTPRRGPITAETPRYTYEATIKNVGTKTITVLGWDYVFTDPDDNEETHHQFYEQSRISPGKQRVLSKTVPTPETRTVDADKADKKLIEEVIINYIRYEDGSIWRRKKDDEAARLPNYGSNRFSPSQLVKICFSNSVASAFSFIE